jgi:hypothetical protein
LTRPATAPTGAWCGPGGSPGSRSGPGASSTDHRPAHGAPGDTSSDPWRPPHEFAPRRPRPPVAAAAARLTALALTLVPGALASKKGSPHPEPEPAPAVDLLLARGATTVTLDPGTAAALRSLDIALTPVRPAWAGRKGISFPITFGVVDGATLAGQIRHSGGLKATRGGTTVYLTRYCIDIDDTPSLTGLVGAAPNSGARVELFDLDLTNLEVIPGRRHVTLKGVALTLTDDAATAPNGAFGDGAEPFAEGLPIGTARVTGRTWSRGG